MRYAHHIRTKAVVFVLSVFLCSFSSGNVLSQEKIVFHSDRSGKMQLFVMDSDGSNQTRFINTPYNDFGASWSPDGSRIAFASDRDGNFAQGNDVYVMDADGSNQTRLTVNSANDYLPSWSPDGTKIVYVSTYQNPGGYIDIFIMNSDGTNQVNLTNTLNDNFSPSFSPDGTRIMFESRHTGNYELYTMNTDGSTQINITNTPGEDRGGAWSPDGSKIAFYSERDGNAEIYVMNADGSNQTRLTNNSASDLNACWSSDGSKIAFSSTRDGNYEIYVMNADGSNQTNVTNDPGNDYNPSCKSDIPATITLTSPNGGETWEAGTTQYITWTSTSVSKVNIEFSVDGGSSWETIATNIASSTESYAWIVPGISSSQCRIHITDDFNRYVSDVSDQSFTISYSDYIEGYGTQLTFSGKEKRWGTDWSTNGTWITYSEKSDDGLFDIWIVPVSGGVPINLTENIEGSHSIVSFSPYESTFIFNSRGADDADISNYKIHRINNLDTKEYEVLINQAQNASMSHSGSLIVYRAVPSMDLVIWDIGSENTITLGTETEIDYPVQIFSHDNSHIITQKKVDGEIKLFQIPVGGGQFEQLTTIAGDHWYPYSSSYGKWILYTELQQNKIWAYNTFSGESKELFPESPFKHQGGSFSVDGSKISYFRENAVGSGNYEVFIVDSPFRSLRVLDSIGTYWPAETTQSIRWSHVMVEKIMIEFSSDNGVNWSTVVEDYDTKTGEYEWITPNINSTQCLIKITDESDSDIWDVSEEVFTIKPGIPSGEITLTSPNGGETLETGKQYDITWTSSGINTVIIVFSVNGGNTWQSVKGSIPASQGTFIWTVPNVSSDECLIKIVDTQNETVFDTSDNTFEISTVKNITVTTPNSGEKWPSNSTQTIKWTKSNIHYVNIEFSVDGGSSWETIATNILVNTYDWQVPGNTTSQGKIRVVDAADSNVWDESDGYFEILSTDYINIVSPAANDIWSVDSTKEIVWGFGGDITNVKIELSLDSGSTWSVLASSVDAFTGSYQFTVPGTSSTDCRIRISDVSNPETYKISGKFEIRLAELYLIHTPIEEAEELEEMIFNARVVSGASEIESVRLYYRTAGETAFEDSVSLTLMNPDTKDYSYTMETGYFTAPGMDYYIVVIDDGGTEARAPIDEGFYSITANILGIKSTDTTTGGTSQNAYRMISVPINFSSTSINDQLMGNLPSGNYGNDWRLFRYSPGSTSPAEYPDIEGFSPGNAFWFITKNDYQLNTVGGMTVATSSPFNITLKQGWNDIGNPWLFDISWDDIENPSGAQLSVLYSYDGTWSDPTNPPTTMEPWKGYAVYSYSNVNTIIKLHPENDTGSAKPIAEDTDIDWILSIKASAGDARDISNHLGVRPDAKTEWDRFDHIEPPVIGDYVSVSFPHDDWEEYPHSYTVDFRPSANILEWDFDVKTNISSEMVVVQLEGIDNLPDEYQVLIYDLDLKNIIDDTYNSFSFVSGTLQENNPSERHFRLVVTNEEYTEPDEFISVPTEFLTASCYPNPFNPQTTIQYVLSEPDNVIISIFNSVGQQILRHNAGSIQPGTHNFIFDASEFTTGTYFYRIETGISTVSGKMLYMK